MIGKYIQKQRENLGLTQEYVAKKLGISRPTYILIEQNKRDLMLKEAIQLADVLQITLEDLVEQLERKDANSDTTYSVVADRERDKKQNIRINIPQKNLDKFREVLLYVLSQVGAKPNVGETVIYKLLYFIDFNYYEKYEEQLIGATYIKNTFGPTPVEFKKLVDDMIKKGELIEIKSKYFNNDQKKYLAVREPNLAKSLNAQELKHIDEVLAQLSDKNASELSAYSHQDVPWIVTEKGKPIDYETVFYRTPKTSVRNYGEN